MGLGSFNMFLDKHNFRLAFFFNTTTYSNSALQKFCNKSQLHEILPSAAFVRIMKSSLSPHKSPLPPESVSWRFSVAVLALCSKFWLLTES